MSRTFMEMGEGARLPGRLPGRLPPPTSLQSPSQLELKAQPPEWAGPTPKLLAGLSPEDMTRRRSMSFGKEGDPDR